MPEMIFLNLTIKTPGCWSRFGVFIVNFEHISHFFLVFLLLNIRWVLFTVGYQGTCSNLIIETEKNCEIY